MLQVIRNLREIASCCAEGRALPHELARWLAQSIDAFLVHRFTSLDAALGLCFARGGVPWWLEEGMRCRDAALRELAARFAGDKSLTAQAAQVAALSRRFAASNWLVDREHGEMPARYVGAANQLLWIAFKSGAPMPLGDRRLRSILAGGRTSRSPTNGGDPGGRGPGRPTNDNNAGGHSPGRPMNDSDPVDPRPRPTRPVTSDKIAAR